MKRIYKRSKKYVKEVLELLREKIYERVTQLVSHTETTGDKAKRNSARRYQCEVTIGDKVRVGYRFRKCSTANQWCVVKCCDIIASHPSAVEDDGGDVGGSYDTYRLLSETLVCKVIPLPPQKTRQEHSVEVEERSTMEHHHQADLEADISRFSSVRELTPRHLRYLLSKNMAYLRGIFTGRSPCRRHSDYSRGGARNANLTYQVKFGAYSESQDDIIIDALMAGFCKGSLRRMMYADYIMKVLFPECLIKIYMDVHGIGYEESERVMSTHTLERD